MRGIAVWVLALTLLLATVPSTVLAGSTFGPTREIYLPNQANNPARPIYLDLENNREVNSAANADISFQMATDNDESGHLNAVSGQAGIDLVSSDYDSVQPTADGVSFAHTAPLQIGGAYLVRTRSGRLARLKPMELAQDDNVVHLQYSVVGDTDQNSPGDTGSVAVTFSSPQFANVNGTVKLDLEAGTYAMDDSRADIALTVTGDADHLVGANLTVTALHAQGVIDEGIRGFDGLRSFPATGFLSSAEGRALDLYLVKTRNGKYAKFLIKQDNIIAPPTPTPDMPTPPHHFVVQFATQTGTTQPVQADAGGLQGHTGITLLSGQGLDVKAGAIVDQINGDIYLAPGGILASGTGTANIVEMGNNSPDKIKAAPATGYSAGPMRAYERHTYAVKTRDGKYGLVYVESLADGKAVVDTYYQPDGTTTFFDFISVDNGTASDQGTDINSTQWSNHGGTTISGGPGGTTSGQGPSGGTTVGSGATSTSGTSVGSGALGYTPDPTMVQSNWSIQGETFLGEVYLSWNTPPGVDPSTISGYFIFQGDTLGDVNSMVNPEPLKAMHYTVSNLKDGQTVYFQVQVFDNRQDLGKRSVMLAVTPGKNGAVTVVGANGYNGSDISGGSAGSGNGPQIRFWLDNTTMQVNGQSKTLPVAPQTINGRSYVPFRALGDALGAKVSYDPSIRTVRYELGQQVLLLFLDSPHNAVVNGTVTHLDDGPVVINGSTLVPVRFVSQVLGRKVSWNDADRSITITSP